MNMVDSIIAAVIKEIDKRLPKIRYGTYLDKEETDADLSMVLLAGGSTSRYVPKLKHVTLTKDDTVMLLTGGGGGYTIVGVIAGDKTMVNEIIP